MKEGVSAEKAWWVHKIKTVRMHRFYFMLFYE